MAVTKTGATIQASTSNAASATQTGTIRNLTSSIGALLTIKMTNGATGPTVACSAKVYTSSDGTNLKLYTTLTGTTANTDVQEFPVEIPPATMYLQVVFVGNTGQAVTVEALTQELLTV